MESTPKNATEKIGEVIRKKLPKKSVGLAGCENGLFKKGSGPAADRMAVRGDFDPASLSRDNLSRTSIGTLPIWQILCVVDLRKYVTFWASSCYPIKNFLPNKVQIFSD